eukprot:10049557-Alexandrium_andersonii.AAC.1
MPSPPGRVGISCLERFRGRGRHSRHVQCKSSNGVQHGGPVGLRARKIAIIVRTGKVQAGRAFVCRMLSALKHHVASIA